MSQARERTQPWDLRDDKYAHLLTELQHTRGDSLGKRAWKRVRRQRGARVSSTFLLVFAILSALAPLLPLPSPVALDLVKKPLPPVAPWVELGNDRYKPVYWELNPVDASLVGLRQTVFGSWQTGAWLGTDAKGRDLLSRILWGSRTSFLVALAAGACSLVIGVTYGAIAGFVGGRVDNVMMRVVDILLSLPVVFVVIFVLGLFDQAGGAIEGRSSPLDREKVFFVVIGAIYWLTMARVVRGQVLGMRNAEFVDAARLSGAGLRAILVRHVLPNIISVVVVYLTLTIPAILLFEAFLSFLGLGVEAPKVSWGLLAADGTDALNPLELFWWLALFPAAAIAGTLLALNVLGDCLRDALDPKKVELG